MGFALLLTLQQWWPSQCWVPRGLLGGVGHLLGSGVGPPFLWVMLCFLALQYFGDCHVQPDQISVQDELLWVLPVPGGAERGVSPSWEGVWGPL